MDHLTMCHMMSHMQHMMSQISARLHPSSRPSEAQHKPFSEVRFSQQQRQTLSYQVPLAQQHALQAETSDNPRTGGDKLQLGPIRMSIASETIMSPQSPSRLTDNLDRSVPEYGGSVPCLLPQQATSIMTVPCTASYPVLPPNMPYSTSAPIWHAPFSTPGQQQPTMTPIAAAQHCPYGQYVENKHQAPLQQPPPMVQPEQKTRSVENVDGAHRGKHIGAYHSQQEAPQSQQQPQQQEQQQPPRERRGRHSGTNAQLNEEKPTGRPPTTFCSIRPNHQATTPTIQFTAYNDVGSNEVAGAHDSLGLAGDNGDKKVLDANQSSTKEIGVGNETSSFMSHAKAVKVEATPVLQRTSRSDPLFMQYKAYVDQEIAKMRLENVQKAMFKTPETYDGILQLCLLSEAEVRALHRVDSARYTKARNVRRVYFAKPGTKEAENRHTMAVLSPTLYRKAEGYKRPTPKRIKHGDCDNAAAMSSATGLTTGSPSTQEGLPMYDIYDAYDVIKAAHERAGHQKRSTTEYVAATASGIPGWIINAYISTCQVCREKKAIRESKAAASSASMIGGGMANEKSLISVKEEDSHAEDSTVAKNVVAISCADATSNTRVMSTTLEATTEAGVSLSPFIDGATREIYENDEFYDLQYDVEMRQVTATESVVVVVERGTGAPLVLSAVSRRVEDASHTVSAGLAMHAVPLLLATSGCSAFKSSLEAAFETSLCHGERSPLIVHWNSKPPRIEEIIEDVKKLCAETPSSWPMLLPRLHRQHLRAAIGVDASGCATNCKHEIGADAPVKASLEPTTRNRRRSVFATKTTRLVGLLRNEYWPAVCDAVKSNGQLDVDKLLDSLSAWETTELYLLGAALARDDPNFRSRQQQGMNKNGQGVGSRKRDLSDFTHLSGESGEEGVGCDEHSARIMTEDKGIGVDVDV